MSYFPCARGCGGYIGMINTTMYTCNCPPSVPEGPAPATMVPGGEAGPESIGVVAGDLDYAWVGLPGGTIDATILYTPTVFTDAEMG